VENIEKNKFNSRIGVAVLAAKRPEYFQKVLSSLQHQSVALGDDFDVFLFVDRIDKDKKGYDENQQVLKLAKEFDDASRSRSTLDVRTRTGKHQGGGIYSPANTNFGIARMTMWAIETIFAPHLQASNMPVLFNIESDKKVHSIQTHQKYVYERILILEDDQLIAHNYVEAMGMLLTAAEDMKHVAVVNGNFINTPQHGYKRKNMLLLRNDDCQFQIAPLNAITQINSHNVWAWATTWKKWESIHATYLDAFQKSHLDTLEYGKRDTKTIGKVMDDLCPGSGYSKNWKGQDWLRACAFYAQGMRYKLQPTQRLMSYIGQSGLHESKESYRRKGFHPVDAHELRVSLKGYPRDLCTRTCYLERMN